MGNHVLITGGAGFIGSNLSRYLLRQGYSVDCVDNLITGRLNSISDLRDHENFRFFNFDITDSRFVWAFSQRSYCKIFHLACPTGVPNIELLGEEMLETCSVGTSQTLKLAMVCNAKLVAASSAEVYGDPEVFPQQEAYTGNVDPMGPRSAYEEGKRFVEALVALYARKYGLDAKIVRIFNTFGEGMSPQDQRVIPQFMSKIVDGHPVTIFGDGGQKRTFLHVDDLVRGLETVINKGKPGEAYNIGGTEPVTILELVRMVERAIDCEVAIKHEPHFTTDHQGRLPETSKVRAIGWSAEVPVMEGLTRSFNAIHAELSRCRQQSLG